MPRASQLFLPTLREDPADAEAISHKLLVRGAYYDQYEPARQPIDCDSPDEFSAEVAEWLADGRPVDPDEAIRAVFEVLERHLSPGMLTKIRAALPKGIRLAWGSADARLVTEAAG